MAERTESTITIEAPPADVVRVVADLEAYPEWAGGITAVEVLDTDEEGRPSEARLTMANGPVRDTLHVRYEWALTTAGTGTVSWSLVEPGSVTSQMDGAYVLVAAGDGTQVTYRLEVDVTVRLPGLLRRRAEKMITDTALKDLRGRVEG
ncbi:SRPBCC family protein [Aquipuribacter nitratireducens]|uniref:SRPBCC family protein n=1 Tax=Aquipuribacter nitratireducens TaxID=650104 RepID=A0ABW0GRT7_9MICO